MQNKLIHNVTPIRSGVNLGVAVLLVAGLSMFTMSANAYVAKTETVKAKVDPYLLERKNGVQRVYASLEQQAEQACRRNGNPTLLDKRLSKMCAKNLLNDFVKNLNDERVTAYHVRAIAR